MTRDTLGSLEAVAEVRQDFLDSLSRGEQRRLSERAGLIRAMLGHDEAYNQVPGRDPQAGSP